MSFVGALLGSPSPEETPWPPWNSTWVSPTFHELLRLCAWGERCGMGHIPGGSGGLEPGQGLPALFRGLYRAPKLHRGACASGRSSRASGTCSHQQRPAAPGDSGTRCPGTAWGHRGHPGGGTALTSPHIHLHRFPGHQLGLGGARRGSPVGPPALSQPCSPPGSDPSTQNSFINGTLLDFPEWFGLERP